MTLVISGKVIHGEHYGKQLGFPTANLDRREFARKKMKIKLGVWAGLAQVSSRIYKAGIVIGPIDGNRLPKIEAYLLNFKGNLYGKKITISLKKYLRPFKKYTNEGNLKIQINTQLLKH